MSSPPLPPPPVFPPAWAAGWGEDLYGCFASLELAPGEEVATASSRKWKRPVEMVWRWLPPGSFRRGDDLDGPAHQVILTRGFWLADTACTQAHWRAVMGEHESYFPGDDLPVERVSWEDCQTFCQRLNQRFATEVFRLPSEAQWEYACRAGTTTAYAFGDDISQRIVNFDGKKTVPVRSLPANPWGLYEVHGNVWEWCQDWYGAYSSEDQVDPEEPSDGEVRVVRGGSWNAPAWCCRSAFRDRNQPLNRVRHLGFRLAAGQG